MAIPFNDASKGFWTYLVGAKLGVSEINNDDQLRDLVELTGIGGDIVWPGVISPSVGGAVLAPSPTGGDDRTSLQDFLTNYSGRIITFRQGATYLVSGPLTVGSGTVIDMQGATIQATSAATYQPIFTANNVDKFIVFNGKFVWTGKAYTESTTTYPACVIRATGTSKNIRLADSLVVGFPGAAVYATDTDGVYVTNNNIIGVGNGGGGGTFNFVAGTSKDNAGVIFDGSTRDVFITGNEISYCAQGVLGGQGAANVHVNGNTIHDIGGQHGVYLNQLVNAEVTNNLLRNLAATGVKIQTQSGAPDCIGVAVTGNVIDTVGGSGIQFTCASNAVPSRHRQVVVSGNTVRGAANDGIVLEFVESGSCTGNLLDNVRAGIRATDFVGLSIKSNRIVTCTQEGILIQSLLFSSSQCVASNNDITNPATANNAATEFGIRIAEGGGFTTTDITLDTNRIVDYLGNVRYLIYNSTASQTTVSYRNNTGSGATDYGHRGPATQARELVGNNLAGTIGRYFATPSVETVGDPFLTTYSSAAPVAGTWVRGDRCWNTTPAASGTPGWVCVASGTPGTWKAMGNLSA